MCLLFLLGTISYGALQGGVRMPPDIVVKSHAAAHRSDGYLVTFEVFNRGDETAASLDMEGRLLADGRVIETSKATIDYVAGHGSAEGGLFFVHDPAKLTIEVRPLGFQKP